LQQKTTETPQIKSFNKIKKNKTMKLKLFISKIFSNLGRKLSRKNNQNHNDKIAQNDTQDFRDYADYKQEEIEKFNQNMEHFFDRNIYQ